MKANKNSNVGWARPEAVARQDNAEWPVLPIEQIADVNPRIDKSSIPDDLPVSFVPMPAVGAGDGSIQVGETRPAGEVKKGFTAFLEGDVLFAKITPCMENGKMAVVPKLVNGYGFGSTEFHVLRPKPGMDAKYLYYYVSSQTFRSEAERHMTGAVGQRRVPTAYLKECKIPVAPLDQQQRIVTEIEKQFSRLDEAVANLKRVKANLKRYKAAVLKAAVEGRLVETEAELARREGRNYETGAQLLQRILETRRSQWKGKGKYKEPAAPDTTVLPELPVGWVWATWDQISQWVTYGFTRPMPHVNEGIPIVTAKHVVNGKIELDETHKTPYENYAELSDKDRPEPGDILLTKDGTIGRAAVVPGHDGFCINQSVAVIWLRSCPIDRRFLLAVIDSELVQKPVREKARGVAIKHLSITDFARLPLPLPPIDDQRCIVRELDRRLSLVLEIEAQVNANNKRAERLRQATLGRAFYFNRVPRSK